MKKVIRLKSYFFPYLLLKKIKFFEKIKFN